MHYYPLLLLALLLTACSKPSTSSTTGEPTASDTAACELAFRDFRARLARVRCEENSTPPQIRLKCTAPTEELVLEEYGLSKQSGAGAIGAAKILVHYSWYKGVSTLLQEYENFLSQPQSRCESTSSERLSVVQDVHRQVSTWIARSERTLDEAKVAALQAYSPKLAELQSTTAGIEATHADLKQFEEQFSALGLIIKDRSLSHLTLDNGNFDPRYKELLRNYYPSLKSYVEQVTKFPLALSNPSSAQNLLPSEADSSETFLRKCVPLFSEDSEERKALLAKEYYEGSILRMEAVGDALWEIDFLIPAMKQAIAQSQLRKAGLWPVVAENSDSELVRVFKVDFLDQATDDELKYLSHLAKQFIEHSRHLRSAPSLSASSKNAVWFDHSQTLTLGVLPAFERVVSDESFSSTKRLREELKAYSASQGIGVEKLNSLPAITPLDATMQKIVNEFELILDAYEQREEENLPPSPAALFDVG